MNFIESGGAKWSDDPKYILLVKLSIFIIGSSIDL